jgi:hypothetical protein
MSGHHATRQEHVHVEERWQQLFERELARTIAGSPAHIAPEAPERAAQAVLGTLMQSGSVVVGETRRRLEGMGSLEPFLTLIQLYAGAIHGMCEQDLAREEAGVRSLFHSALLTSRWMLLEIAHGVRAVLLLTSRGLDVQAALVLRQAWELAARATVLASDVDLGARFDRFSTDEPDRIERSRLESEVRERLSPQRAFEVLARLESELGGGPEESSEAWRVLRQDYAVLSNLAHGGSLLAGVSESCNSSRYEELADGASAPVDGDQPLHFLDLLRRVIDMLSYFVGVFPLIALRDENSPGIRRFFEDWVGLDHDQTDFRREYRLYLALNTLGALVPVYYDLVYGARASE